MFAVKFTYFGGVFLTFRVVDSGSPLMEWHDFVIFGVIREMYSYTGYTQVDVTNVAAHRGDGGLTEVTPDDVLGGVGRVHVIKTSVQSNNILKKYKHHENFSQNRINFNHLRLKL